MNNTPWVIPSSHLCVKSHNTRGERNLSYRYYRMRSFSFLPNFQPPLMLSLVSYLSQARSLQIYGKKKKKQNPWELIAGYPPIRFAHSRENQVLRKSKRYAPVFFFFG